MIIMTTNTHIIVEGTLTLHSRGSINSQDLLVLCKTSSVPLNPVATVWTKRFHLTVLTHIEGDCNDVQ